jgi:DNA-binding response OmpR family regulator
MARVLLVDDDASLLDVLSLALQDAGHDVATARDGQMGWSLLRAHGHDLVVSDVNMPVLDGFSLCRRIRESGSAVPIVLLTSRDDEVDEALGFELGADDYVSKPFSTRILLARIAALVRRQQLRSGGGAGTVLRVGALALDGERLEIRYLDQPIESTLTEFRMLEALARRPGVVFSRTRLLEHVRGDDSVVAERIVDTYVKRLRRKLETVDPTFDRIETVVGAGYRWRG